MSSTAVCSYQLTDSDLEIMLQFRKSCVLLVAIIVGVILLFYIFIREDFHAMSSSSAQYSGIEKVQHHPSNNSALQKITIVTVCQGSSCLHNFGSIRNSLFDRGYNLFRIEISGAFNWPKLALAYSEFALKFIPSDHIAVYLDASDILAQGCPSELLSRYHELVAGQNKSMVVGVESHCSNKNKCHKLKNIDPPDVRIRSKELKYINGGFVAGTVEATSRAWKEIGLRFKDTQLGLGTYVDEHPDIVAIDWNQQIVASNTAQEWSEHFTMAPPFGVTHKSMVRTNGGETAVGSVAATSSKEAQPVFVHVLCHTCGDRHPTGRGGPQAYRSIVDLVLNASQTKC